MLTRSKRSFYKKQKPDEAVGSTSDLLAVSWTREGFHKALVVYVVLNELPLRHERVKALDSI